MSDIIKSATKHIKNLSHGPITDKHSKNMGMGMYDDASAKAKPLSKAEYLAKRLDYLSHAAEKGWNDEEEELIYKEDNSNL